MSELSAALLIISFQFSLLFFHISVATRQAAPVLLLVFIRNIGHRTLPKIWVGTFLVRNVHPGKDCDLILTVKMETRHPVDGQLCGEFPAICNHCVVITA